MVYFVGWSLFLVFFTIYLNFKVVGRGNIPKHGAFIFVSNHASYFDPILLGTSIHRSLYYMARENLFAKDFSDWIMRGVHAFPVRRNKGDLGALRQALTISTSTAPSRPAANCMIWTGRLVSFRAKSRTPIYA